MIGAGQELGGYTIIKRIGGGGLGEVFLAQHRRVNRRAAVKVLLPELAQKASVLEQFFKEARNTSLIRHPGIVEIFDCDIVGGQPFVITEFLEGESLGAYLGRVGTLETDLAFLLGVMSGVATAVEAAHRAGIMHRDLKPENVYLHLSNPAEPAVTVKVLDFGIAKLSREDGGPSQTKTGMWLASPTYMSPEQCRGVGRPDARSDVYSLGCVFYRALCGRPPFEAPAIVDLILGHLTQPPKPPIKYVPELAPKLNSLILRMLAKKPEERPQSMEQVVTTLHDCARALGIDVEGQLLPLVPVERPVALLGAALAGVAPKPGTGATRTGAMPVVSSMPAPMSPPVSPAPDMVSRPAPPPAALPAEAQAAPRPSPVPPVRVVPATQVAAEPSATPAPAVAVARAFPRTLIAGAAERQAIAEGRLPELRPEARIEGLVGGTMVLEPARAARPAPAASPAPAAPVAPAGRVRPQIGGTRIMEQPPADEPDESEAAEDDSQHEPEVISAPQTRGGEHTMHVPAGGDGWMTRLVPLLTGNAGLAALGLVAVAALVIVMARLLGGSTPVAPRSGATVEPPAAIEPPPIPSAPAPAEAPPLRPATVSIDIQGLLDDTQVLVDDQLVTLPVRVPRGPELHRFTLRPSHGAERTIEIDGTRDRVVELVMAPEGKTRPNAPRTPAPRPARAAPPGTPQQPSAKARPGASYSKAITDL